MLKGQSCTLTFGTRPRSIDNTVTFEIARIDKTSSDIFTCTKKKWQAQMNDLPLLMTHGTSEVLICLPDFMIHNIRFYILI